MYRIDMHLTNGTVVGKWFAVFYTEDGTDAASYLKTTTENDDRDVEYRMLWIPLAKCNKWDNMILEAMAKDRAMPRQPL